MQPSQQRDAFGSDGTVIGFDVSIPMLLEAEAKVSAPNVSFLAADAQNLPFPNDTFDAAICLFGLMFFRDSVAALRGLRGLLHRGRRAIATTWGNPEEAPFAGLVAEELCVELPGERKDLLLPFSLASRERLEALFHDAGYSDIQVSRETRRARFSSFQADFWEPIEAGGGRAWSSVPWPADAAARCRPETRPSQDPGRAGGLLRTGPVCLGSGRDGLRTSSR